MKSTNTISSVKKSSKRIPRTSGDRIAVIVFTPINKRNGYYGVQFWTSEMIKKGTSKNTDNSISIFKEKL